MITVKVNEAPQPQEILARDVQPGQIAVGTGGGYTGEVFLGTYGGIVGLTGEPGFSFTFRLTDTSGPLYNNKGPNFPVRLLPSGTSLTLTVD